MTTTALTIRADEMITWVALVSGGGGIFPVSFLWVVTPSLRSGFQWDSRPASVSSVGGARSLFQSGGAAERQERKILISVHLSLSFGSLQSLRSLLFTSLGRKTHLYKTKVEEEREINSIVGLVVDPLLGLGYSHCRLFRSTVSESAN